MEFFQDVQVGIHRHQVPGTGGRQTVEDMVVVGIATDA